MNSEDIVEELKSVLFKLSFNTSEKAFLKVYVEYKAILLDCQLNFPNNTIISKILINPSGVARRILSKDYFGASDLLCSEITSLLPTL